MVGFVFFVIGVWKPKVKFKELVRIMVDADLKALRENETVR